MNRSPSDPVLVVMMGVLFSSCGGNDPTTVARSVSPLAAQDPPAKDSTIVEEYRSDRGDRSPQEQHGLATLPLEAACSLIGQRCGRTFSTRNPGDGRESVAEVQVFTVSPAARRSEEEIKRDFEALGAAESRGLGGRRTSVALAA